MEQDTRRAAGGITSYLYGQSCTSIEALCDTSGETVRRPDLLHESFSTPLQAISQEINGETKTHGYSRLARRSRTPGAAYNSV